MLFGINFRFVSNFLEVYQPVFMIVCAWGLGTTCGVMLMIQIQLVFEIFDILLNSYKIVGSTACLCIFDYFSFAAWIHFVTGVADNDFLRMLCIWTRIRDLWAWTTLDWRIRANQWRNQLLWLVFVSTRNATIATHNYGCNAEGSRAWVLRQHCGNTRHFQKSRFCVNSENIQRNSNFIQNQWQKSFFQVVKGGNSYFMIMRQFM